MKKIEWNKVTPLSQAIAVVLFVAVFGLAFWLGSAWSAAKFEDNPPAPKAAESQKLFTFACAQGKSIWVAFHGQDSASLSLSDGRSIDLPRAISGSGARYATKDESIVFWNKGDTAFLQEQGTTTYDRCSQK